jgi:acetylornithine deacetylase/succinyl-diaminopimelate desuccinylase-like protein
MRTSLRANLQSIAGQLGRAAQPAGHSLHLDLLQRLLAVPSYSRQEGQMVEFLVEHVRQGGVGLRGTCLVDEWNNVFIRKGDAQPCPCVAAHIDTVHWPRPVEIVEQDCILFGLDQQGQRTGIGGDDKAGVYVCLELLERLDNIAVALFAAEEIGCLGANHAPAKWFNDVGYVIEFDCPGRGLVSYTSNGVRLFANDGEFINTALPVLQQHGLTRWQHHPLADVMALRRRFEFSCFNLSCGYHLWHQPDECVVLDEVAAALAAGEDLVRMLGCRRYVFDADDSDATLPRLEVTGLRVA